MDLTDCIYVFINIHSYMCNINSNRIEEKTWKGRNEIIKLLLKGLSEPEGLRPPGEQHSQDQLIRDHKTSQTSDNHGVYIGLC